MSILAMKKVEIVAMRRDIDTILEALGAESCFQIATPVQHGQAEDLGGGDVGRKAEAAKISPLAAALDRVKAARRILGFEVPEFLPAGIRMPTSDDEARLDRFWTKVAAFDAESRANVDKITRAREALEEARAFGGLSLPWTSLDQLSFISVRIGHIEAPALAELKPRLGAKTLLMPADEKNLVVAVTTKSGRFGLDGELAKAGFVAKAFQADFKGIPAELPAALEKELSLLEARSVEIERRRQELKAELEAEWQELAASFAVAEAIEDAKEGLEGSKQALRLVGWMPKDRIKAVSERIGTLSAGRVAFRTFSPREVESVRKGEEEVPVLTTKPFYFKNFERMVNSYGVPSYGSIDPTPFVAVFFTIFFAIMFGDLGQGFLVFAAGIALQRELIPSLKKWKIFAPIVIAAGAGSMVMGLLTGSLFSNEKVLEPLENILTAFFLGHAEPRFLDILPGAKTIGTIMIFFGVTLVIGVVVNSLGLIFYMVNKIRSGRVGEAIFAKTGLCGAFFLWWAIGMGVRVLLGGKLGWWDGIGLGLPIILLIFEEQLAGIVDGHKHHNDDGAFANIIKAVVIVIETFSYYSSVTLSFLRIGAFALSHVVLSFVTFKMIDMVGNTGLGTLWGVLIFIIFNVIILVLEGMVVAIQVVRLQYYEFLSKFVTETGKLFAPFRFNLSKE